jgi:hypothetical protein
MNKKTIILPLLLFIAVMMVGFVNASCTLNTTKIGTWVGTEIVQVNCTTLRFVSNCSITATSTTPSSTFTITLFNDTPNVNYANGTINTLGYLDAAAWIVTGTCTNYTNNTPPGPTTETLITSSGQIIDNTLPNIRTAMLLNGVALSNTSLTEDSTNEVIFNVTNATTCNVYWKDTTANAMATDYADVDCSFTGSSSYVAGGTKATCSLKQASDGFNTIYADCTDGTNTTTSTTYKFNLGGYSNTQEITKGTSIYSQILLVTQDKSAMVLGLGLVAVLLIIAAYFVIQKKR